MSRRAMSRPGRVSPGHFAEAACLTLGRCGCAAATGRILLAGVRHGLRQLPHRTGLLAHFESRDSVEHAVAELRPTT